jgi:hypothetical protein
MFAGGMDAPLDGLTIATTVALPIVLTGMLVATGSVASAFESKKNVMTPL